VLKKTTFVRAATPEQHDARKVWEDTALVCFSHLRWDFVFQRPQHIMSRLSESLAVHFWEEHRVSEDAKAPFLDIAKCPQSSVVIVRPVVPADFGAKEIEAHLEMLFSDYAANLRAARLIKWYYTPMLLPFSERVEADCTVYDCMDELANFRFAPRKLAGLERRLFGIADVVFTGGYSLYEAKRKQHPNVHPFPSSVDREHFAQARHTEPLAAYSTIPSPRLGFYGVLDERLDLELVASVADARPDWQLVMVGPLAKIDESDLPRRPNIHYLGRATYDELPAHLASWDAAMMPFAVNESTRFISPTKTPEYLAGGRPVASTRITDVARHYGRLDGVFIADRDNFVGACEAALICARADGWLQAVDVALGSMSWDRTVEAMTAQISRCLAAIPTHRARTRAEVASSLRETQLSSAVRRAQRAWQGARSKPFDYLVVGAGFAGSVLAERLATQLDKRVLLIDKRNHIGGNAYDFHNEAGVLMHQYGPHIFHTNSDHIFRYLSQFTAWRPYEHRVRAVVEGQRLPMPINRTTLNQLYGLTLSSDEEAAAFLATRAEPVDQVRTSEDVVVSAVGRDLYEKFFRGYTRKQWGLDPSELDKSVTARIPTRTSTDDRYFQDRHQMMPAAGYTRMFENMLDDPRISIELAVDFETVKAEQAYDRLIFTGPVDAYFDHRFGHLPYRSLRFEHVTLNQEWFQDVGTVNYPDETIPYTRVSEYKHLTGQQHASTTITYEFPCADGDPYYPVPRPESQSLYKRYEALALASPEVVFCGRLATYRYYNMDQVVGQALATFGRIAGRQAAGADLPAFQPGNALTGAPLTPASTARTLPASG
jgi:UDP-galactopyranose mutase